MPIVRTLLDAGANRNDRRTVFQHGADEYPCALHLMTIRHDPAIADLLVERGASLDSTYKGFTAQFRAAHRGDVGMVQRLVELGGDPVGVNTLDRNCNPPLACHLRNFDLDKVDKLFKHGAAAQIAMQSKA
ncbi:ankyrin repeat domain-containing protein [Paraburkholderia saeva]|uniref:hypothetical protein n=1 Tax=Paraburkholderia saeva TaxID=2777537 RepID=UPI001E550D99|nr:hypothetical protein [Paraburkholderia saeva]